MKTRLLLAVLAVAFLGISGIANAKNKKTKEQRQAIWYVYMLENPEEHAEIREKMKKIRELKETDMETFKAKKKQIYRKVYAAFEAYLEKLKRGNSEKYAEVMKKLKEMTELFKKDPDAFREKKKELRRSR